MRGVSKRVIARSHCFLGQDADRLAQEERKWLDLFENPAKWQDNRAKNNWQNLPDFKHSETGETLWIRSLYCPRWVESKLKSLNQSFKNNRCDSGTQAKQDPRISRLLSSLKFCSSSKDLETGKKLHLEATQNGLVSNVYIASSLISMYSKCGSLPEARRVFDSSISCSRNTACWNSLLLGYASHGDEETVLELFGKMIEPNCRTFVAVFMALSSLAKKEEIWRDEDDKFVKIGCLERGMEMQSKFLRRDCREDEEPDLIFVENSMIEFYAKCGSLPDSRAVFDRMKQRSVVSWTSLILGCVGNDEGELGLDLFEQLVASGDCALDSKAFVAAIAAAASFAAKQDSDGKLAVLDRARSLHSEAAKNFHDSNTFVANSLIGMYSNCGSLADAKAVFDGMKQRDVVSWTSMILCYAQNDQSELALDLYSSMDCSRDAKAFVAALIACSNFAAEEEGVEACGKIVKPNSLERGMEIHAHVASSGLEKDSFVACVLAEMYTKCGSMVDARSVFDKMENHSLIAWNSLLLGYAGNGEPELTLDLFPVVQELLDLDPVPERTLGAAVLACAKLASIDTGRKLHAQICKDGLECGKFLANSLVNFYAKSGNLTAAQAVFDSAVGGSGWIEIWSALIGGYASQGLTDTVLEMFETMIRSGVDPDGVTMLCVISACSHGGKVAEGRKYFKEMVAKWNIEPGREHYHCMVDMLGKANEIDAAVAMAKEMPFEATAVTWTSILAACHKWGNVEVGRFAFEKLMRVDEAAGYVLMANIASQDKQ